MDELVLESPQVQGVLDICDKTIRRSWNIDDCVIAETVTCELSGMFDNLYLDYVGTGEVPWANATHIVMSGQTCGRVMLWILPW